MQGPGREPGIDRREHIEVASREHVADAVADVDRAWRSIVGDEQMDAHLADILAGTARDLLRVVMAYFVQSGFDVADRDRIERQLARVGRGVDVREWLRTVRLVGVEVIIERLQSRVGLSRTEAARLRESAERITAIAGGEPPDLLPGRAAMLRRLQRTGTDLR